MARKTQKVISKTTGRAYYRILSPSEQLDNEMKTSVPEPTGPIIDAKQTESDADIEKRLDKRFHVLNLMANACLKGESRALIVEGPGGLGKTFEIEQAVKMYDFDKKKTFMAKGFQRTTGLWKLLYEYRQKGRCLIFDDCDSTFKDEDSRNLLKGALDTTEERWLYYGAETRMVSDDGDDIPRQFLFEGSIIFITNFDMDAAAKSGGNASVDFGALISRSHYISMGIRTRRDHIVQMERVVNKLGMLESRGFNKSEQKQIMEYIHTNQDHLRELTLRVVIKVSDLFRAHPSEWKEMADVTVLI